MSLFAAKPEEENPNVDGDEGDDAPHVSIIIYTIIIMFSSIVIHNYSFVMAM